MADIRRELVELQTWARLLDRQAGAMLAMLQEQPNIEHNPTMLVEWQKMKENVARDFAQFILSGMKIL